MAKFCTNCGKEIPDGMAFCTECGVKAPQAKEETVQTVKEEASAVVESIPVYTPPSPQNTYQAPPQQPYQPPAQPISITAESVKGTKFEPISAWGFIGIMILMCIPIIGPVLTLIWACGGCRKVTKRSLARATLILTVIMLIFAVILFFVGKALINTLLDKIGVEFSEDSFLSSFTADEKDDGNKEKKKEKTNILNTPENEEEPTGLSGLLGGIDVDSDYGLGDIGDALGALEALAGLTGGNGGLEALLGGVEETTREAEKQNNGWPNSLRKYPGGTPKEVASYRTIIENTSAEEMKNWINSLKSDGYTYSDFYDIGMSESDMLSANGWWGTNGEYYISVSYSDGAAIVDHLTELPESLAYIN